MAASSMAGIRLVSERSIARRLCAYCVLVLVIILPQVAVQDSIMGRSLAVQSKLMLPVEALSTAKEPTYAPLLANSSKGRVAEEQNWQIVLELQSQAHIALAHVTLIETIHPNATEQWRQIGPFRFRGNATNVKANLASNVPLRLLVSTGNNETSITIPFERPQTAKTEITIHFDWPFRTDQIGSPLTVQSNWFVFHWDSLSVMQLQTEGMIICCDVPQNFTVVTPNLNVTSLKHGAVQIPYNQTQVGDKSIVRFSVVLPKGFLSTFTGAPVPLVYDWIMILYRIEASSSSFSSSSSSLTSSPTSSLKFGPLAAGILASLVLIALPTLIRRSGLIHSGFIRHFSINALRRSRAYCSKCGNRTRGKMRFCTKCGARQR